jgi:prepilin-type N-terminal cleavage/methylation domain-containing protein
MARGYTVLELLLVLSIAAVVLALALPRTLLVLDRVAVHAAAGDVAATLGSARTVALAGRMAVAVDVDTAGGTLRVRRGPEVLWSRNIGQAHGVGVWANRDSLAYDGRGLGLGAANLSIVIRRREAVETVFVSRLGRVR